MKKELNKLKLQIENYDQKLWRKCVRLTNPYEIVPRIDVQKRVSRAFYKMLEILELDLNPNKVLCLCEAPGGFSEAIKYKYPSADIKVQSKIHSTIQFSKKIPKNSILYENVGLGDLFRKETIAHLNSYTHQHGKFNFITADGGIDVSKDYSQQEEMNFFLFKAEISTALNLLEKEGTFVMKFYDTFNNNTKKLLNTIIPKFEKTYCFKPKTSRPCNSEIYFIFINFNPDNLNQNEFDINVRNEYTKLQIECLQKTLNLCNKLNKQKNTQIENYYTNKQIEHSTKLMKKLKIPYQLNSTYLETKQD